MSSSTTSCPSAPIYHILKRCFKALNILKVVSHYDWGGNQDTLLTLYRALIRSRLDNGSSVYGSTRPSYLKTLDPIANQALRICLGAFKTSPAASLQVEAYEPPLHLRREKLALRYAVKIAANPTNPAFKTVFPEPQPSRTPPVRQWRNTIQPFGARIAVNLTTIIAQNHVMETHLLPFPPWLRRLPMIITDLHSGSTKAQSSTHIPLAKF